VNFIFVKIVEMTRELDNLQRKLLESDANLQAKNMQIKDIQNYVDQVIRERDDARLIASSATNVGGSNYRMNSQENQRQQQQVYFFRNSFKII